MKRAIAVCGLLVAGCSTAAAAGDQVLRAAEAKALLARMSRWGCQLQNVDPAAIATTDLDLVVIEPMVDAAANSSLGRERIAAMQRKPDGSRRLVIAYLSVGEAGDYRPYWRGNWRERPAEWLGSPNPKWPGAYGVRFWHPAWQQIVFDAPDSLLSRIIDAGFDGVSLDRVDAYSDWEGERRTAADDMVDMVARLAAKARATRPGFLVVAQNSEGLLPIRRYRAAIDAVSKESLLFGRNGPGVPNTPEQIAWSLHFLTPARRAGKPVLAIEYLDDPAQMAAARQRLAGLGFIPFFGNRLLDRLPAGF